MISRHSKQRHKVECWSPNVSRRRSLVTGPTETQYAAELARQSGKPIVYRNLPEAAYREALVGMGLPTNLAALLADSDVGASDNALFDDGRTLGTLIGRPTTPMAATVREALRM